MRVIATARGYDNVTTREEDDEFEMPDGATGTWFRPVGSPPVPKNPKPAPKAPPKTMSEAANATVAGQFA